MLKHWDLKLKDWQGAIQAWVIGPGLGRDEYMQHFFPRMVKGLPNDCIAVFDADGIYYLCQYPELFR
ncbi:MAG: hypothetical protein KDD45_08895 [Bdellovibrionales bacterium]|nr:hypothetical protein [Bdellovibrionales bacterium]